MEQQRKKEPSNARFASVAAAWVMMVESWRVLVAFMVAGTVFCAAPGVAIAQLSWSGPFPVDSGQETGAVACVSETQCTAVDGSGQEVTFDPQSPVPVISASPIDPSGGGLNAVACPSASQCTAVDHNGIEATFDPVSPGTINLSLVDSAAGFLGAIACVSATQCTAIEDSEREVTFDPQSPATVTPTLINYYGGLQGVACPSSTQCTANGKIGSNSSAAAVLTFDPQAPGTVRVVVLPLGGGPGAVSAMGVACPSTTQCTAVTNGGGPLGGGNVGIVGAVETTFDPQSAVTPTLRAIDAAGVELGAIACGSTSDCVVLDGNGNAIEGNPDSESPWAVEPIPGANVLTSVSCVSSSLCVAVDAAGDAFVGKLQTPPALSGAPPSISGIAQQKQTLTEAHGTWSESPTSYRYQWEACDRSGTSCSEIAGATGQTYHLTKSDVGHTIRVQETASNAAGTSNPASSAPTGLVVLSTASATVTRVQTSHAVVRAIVRCRGALGLTCRLTVTLTATESTHRHVIASQVGRAKARKKIVLAAGTVTIAAGQSRMVTLNPQMKYDRLLADHHRPKVTLTITQTGRGKPILRRPITLETQTRSTPKP